MRVLSFIPAFLLAAASFVAAVPIGPTDATTCVTGGGDDAALQPIMSILADATTKIQPLSDQLTSANSGTPNADVVCGIVGQIDTVVADVIAQLQAAPQVDTSSLDLTNLCATIYALLCLVFTILNTLVAIVLALAGGAVGTLQTVICNLLHSILTLVGCLKMFVAGSTSGVLGPVIALVCSIVDLLLSIVGGLH